MSRGCGPGAVLYTACWERDEQACPEPDGKNWPAALSTACLFLNSRPSSCLRPQVPSCFSRRDCWQFRWQVTEVRAQDLPVQCLPLLSGSLVTLSCIPSVDIPSTQLGQGCHLLSRVCGTGGRLCRWRLSRQVAFLWPVLPRLWDGLWLSLGLAPHAREKPSHLPGLEWLGPTPASPVFL